MFDISICTATAIDIVTNQGVEQALLQFPELLQLRPLLEEIAEVNLQLVHHERMAADCIRRLEELGGELADRAGAVA